LKRKDGFFTISKLQIRKYFPVPHEYAVLFPEDFIFRAENGFIFRAENDCRLFSDVYLSCAKSGSSGTTGKYKRKNNQP